MPVSSRSPNRCPARSFTENTPVKVKLLLKQKTNISVEIFDFRARRCASLLIWTQLFTEENDLRRCQGAGFISVFHVFCYIPLLAATVVKLSILLTQA